MHPPDQSENERRTDILQRWSGEYRSDAIKAERMAGQFSIG